MKKLLMFMVSASLIFMISSTAWATIIFDFESETATAPPFTGVLTLHPMTIGGETVTLSRTGGVGFDIVNNAGFGFPAAFGTRSLIGTIPSAAFPDWLADFSIPVTSTSIDFGDTAAGADDDSPVTLFAFSGLGGTGTLLDSSADFWLVIDIFPSFKTITVSSSTPFSSVLFSSGGIFPNTLIWDNIEVEPIPEPGTIALFGIGMVGLVGAGARRKFKKEKKQISNT